MTATIFYDAVDDWRTKDLDIRVAPAMAGFFIADL